MYFSITVNLPSSAVGMRHAKASGNRDDGEIVPTLKSTSFLRSPIAPVVARRRHGGEFFYVHSSGSIGAKTASGACLRLPGFLLLLVHTGADAVSVFTLAGMSLLRPQHTSYPPHGRVRFAPSRGLYALPAGRWPTLPFRWHASQMRQCGSAAPTLQSAPFSSCCWATILNCAAAQSAYRRQAGLPPSATQWGTHPW